MPSLSRPSLLTQVFACWNWKCALLSATARSAIYLVAMTRTHHADSRAIALVEMAYVTLTAGIYAALQQRALGLRSRLLGNVIVVLGVPGLAQLLDWTTHLLSGAAAPQRATLAVCVFAALSALFHLHVMRNGVFLTGQGRSLADDFRRVPGLIAGFVAKPFTLLATSISRPTRVLESDAAL